MEVKDMTNYLLYGYKMIEDDSTLEKFAQWKKMKNLADGLGSKL